MARGLAVTALVLAATQVPLPPADAATAPMHHAIEADRTLGRLTDLIIQRLRVSDEVAASKFGTGSPIDDPARERQVLDQVRRQAGDLGLDPASATAFFQDQITASKIVQKGLVARWAAHPEQAPTTRPDLGQIRARLDRLTADLLRELKATVRVRDEPTACAVQLAVAAGSGAVLERLDALHRQALTRAVHSVCAVHVD
ncbi:chorismate mutase [Actinomadura gamaensis]|uniref:Chorismate mutase n=1 Tax=Actinomadura gamaensis TaxID=1763541 RepID=A0ABV9U8Z1_9ACTN